MPRLLIHKKKPNPVPPCGRRVEFHIPHSPFQKLLETARVRRNLTYRQLAEEIGTSSGSLWAWLHNKNGFPHPRSLKNHHIERISDVLRIPLPQIKEALDTSRRLYSPIPVVPMPSIDPFETFIQVVENDKRIFLRRSHVLNLAKSLHKTAVSPTSKPS